ncbi:MAG: metalloregulator ArsR/SmtB family transcription factor [Hydrogenophaga sp.]|nr:metalloregulator ArsR/SmtB family transcription factor [Hydrogenophaga sp.]
MKKQTKKPAAGRDERRVQQVFHALAAPPRRAILKYLAESGLTAGEIASRFDMAKPSVSQHLTILETAGLISREKRGQFVHYALVRATVDTVLSGFIDELGAAGSEALPAARTKPANSDKTPARKAAAVETADAEAETADLQVKAAPAQMSMF